MLNELKKSLKSERQDKKIFDIVVFGSSVKGKDAPGDIDIAVIFREGTLKERLNKIQEIKKKINIDKKVDIKAMMLDDLFKEEFFGRSGIILEGISLFNGKAFSEKIDLTGWSLFYYNLKEKSHSEKVKINYLLSGRKSPGIVKSLEGKYLSPGTVLIPIKNSLEFEEVLKKQKISFEKKNILIQN